MIRLRELREKRGLSMMDTAKSLDMPYTTYVNYEKGTREPNIEALFRLADFFEVTIDELLERCAPNEPLTLDELREMDGDPVWFDTIKRWGIVKVNREGIFVVTKSGEYEFGRCKVYRRPPEGEEGDADRG